MPMPPTGPAATFRPVPAGPTDMRRVARVHLLDPTDHVLLLYDDRDPDREAFWYPPGGQIEQAESPEEAATRELREEIGLDATLGPLLMRRRARFTYRGRVFDQDEWHFLARVERPAVVASRTGDNEADAVAAHRWWSLPDLESTREVVFPEGLAVALRRFVIEST